MPQLDCKKKYVTELIFRKALEKQGFFPASVGQAALWFLQSSDLSDSSYNINATMIVKGEVDSLALKKSFERLVARHESFRTQFHLVDGKVVRKVYAVVPMDYEELEATFWESQRLDEKLAQAATMSFDFQARSLLRVRLYRRSKAENYLSITVHHIIGDFWSLMICMRELGDLYACYKKGVPCGNSSSISYSKFVQEQLSYIYSDKGSAQLSYWKRKLDGYEGTTCLPGGEERHAGRINSKRSGEYKGLKLDRALMDKVRALSRELRCTSFSILLGAYYLVLSRYCRDQDIVIGVPTLGRNRAQYENAIGYYSNMIPVRINENPDISVKEFFRNLKDTVLGGMENQQYPFPLIVEKLGYARDGYGLPLVQVAFMYEKSQFEEQSGMLSFLTGGDDRRIRVGGIEAQPVGVPRKNAQFDMTLMVEEVDGALIGQIEFCSSVFSEKIAERFALHWEAVLKAFTDSINQPLRAIEIVTQEERNVITRANSTRNSYDYDDCLFARVSQRALLAPGREALRFLDVSVSYKELIERVEVVSDSLLQIGVQIGELVGLYLDRSVNMVVTILALHKIGAAYVPLDVRAPLARNEQILEEAGIERLIASLHHFNNLAHINYLDIIVTANDESEIQTLFVQAREENNSAVCQPQPLCSQVESNLAYVIYTSGSTGQPKGVAISHRALINVLLAFSEIMPIDEDSRMLAATTICFDISVLELFLPLTLGACTVLAPDELMGAPHDLSQYMRKHSIDIIQGTPAFWSLMLASGWQGIPDGVILCGGDTMSAELANRLRERCSVLFNVYGPTETTIWSSYYRIDDVCHSTVPVGTPINNTKIHVLDDNLKVLPLGVPGNLYISGHGLANGYWKAEALSNERFMVYKGQEEEIRLYDTGDLAVWMETQCERRPLVLAHLGRCDSQVKIRGHRFELSEIEQKLSTCNFIDQCSVNYIEYKAGSNLLVAHIVLAIAYQKKSNSGVDVQGQKLTQLRQEIRRYLTTLLPSYAIPDQYVFVDELPLNSNGKISRKDIIKRFIAFNQEREEVFGVASYDSSTEVRLARIWRDILKVNEVRRDEDFFSLGGHSLLLIELLSLIERDFHVLVPLGDLLRNLRFVHMSELVERICSGDVSEKYRRFYCFNESRSEELLVFFPGIGNLELYSDVLKEFSEEYSVYVFNAFDNPQWGSDFMELAKQSFQAVSRLENFKSITVVGHSAGGWLAYELSVLLSNGSSYNIDGLVLIDSMPPEGGKLRSNDELSASNYAIEPCVTGGEGGAYLNGEIKVPGLDGLLKHDAFKQFFMSSLKWQPSARFSGRTFVARSVEESALPLIYGEQRRHNSLGWSAYCDNIVETFSICGNHTSMLERENISVLVSSLGEFKASVGGRVFGD